MLFRLLGFCGFCGFLGFLLAFLKTFSTLSFTLYNRRMQYNFMNPWNVILYARAPGLAGRVPWTVGTLSNFKKAPPPHRFAKAIATGPPVAATHIIFDFISYTYTSYLPRNRRTQPHPYSIPTPPPASPTNIRSTENKIKKKKKIDKKHSFCYITFVIWNKPNRRR